VRYLFLFTLLSFAAFPAPPDGSDQSLAPWFKSLRQPGSNAFCCALSDCRRVQTRLTPQGYEAFIDRRTFGSTAPDNWVPIPSHTILRNVDNPTGESIACWATGRILCFVHSSEV
jgi:hypothetical protein